MVLTNIECDARIYCSFVLCVQEEKKSEEPPPRYTSLNYAHNNSSLSPDDNIEVCLIIN